MARSRQPPIHTDECGAETAVSVGVGPRDLDTVRPERDAQLAALPPGLRVAVTNGLALDADEHRIEDIALEHSDGAHLALGRRGDTGIRRASARERDDVAVAVANDCERGGVVPTKTYRPSMSAACRPTTPHPPPERSMSTANSAARITWIPRQVSALSAAASYRSSSIRRASRSSGDETASNSVLHCGRVVREVHQSSVGIAAAAFAVDGLDRGPVEGRGVGSQSLLVEGREGAVNDRRAGPMLHGGRPHDVLQCARPHRDGDPILLEDIRHQYVEVRMFDVAMRRGVKA